MRITTQRYIAGLVLIFMISFAARLALTHQYVGLGSPPDANANSDQVDYEVLAYHMVTGQGYAITPGTPTASRTPGTSLMLAPVYTVYGRSFAAGRIWFCLLSAMTCVLAVWLGAACFNRVVGLLAGLGLALYPAHAYSSMHFVSETPFGFWLMFALILTAYAINRRRGGWGMDVLAGMCWAMAVYTRPQLLLAVPVAGGLAAIAYVLRDRRYLRHWAVQAVVITLALSPWVMRNADVMGKPTISTITGYGLWGSHNDLTFNDPAHRGNWVRASDLVDDAHPLTGNEVERNDQATRYGLDAIRANADQVPGLIVMKLWRLVSPIKDTDNRLVQIGFGVGWIVVAPLMLLGLIWALRHTPATAWLLLLPILATVASTVIFYGSDRFRDALAPAYLVIAAAGGYWAYQCLAGRDNDKSISANPSRLMGSNVDPEADSARAA